MTITPKTILLALAASFLFLLIWTKGSASTPPPTSYETKESEASNVTVIVTPKDLSFGKPARFDVMFDTHSVNLDFDVAAIATLTDDQGNTFGTPIWSGDPPGGHHRKGTISFPQTLSPRATLFRLIVSDVAGVPQRVFEWKKGGDTP